MVEVPFITSDEMTELDRRMIEEFHFDLEMMMENAGRALALHAGRLLGKAARERRILVMVGKGNNGGGGLVSARHLHNWGVRTEVILSSNEDDMKEIPARQLRILKSIGVPIFRTNSEIEFANYGLIIDALLGYNQKGNPKAGIAELVRRANDSRKPILALDIPTGLDPNTGRANNPCIKASHTLTLALPKKGLGAKTAKRYVGTLFLADISVPGKLYREFGADSPIFLTDSIIRLSGSKFRERLGPRTR